MNLCFGSHFVLLNKCLDTKKAVSQLGSQVDPSSPYWLKGDPLTGISEITSLQDENDQKVVSLLKKEGIIFRSQPTKDYFKAQFQNHCKVSKDAETQADQLIKNILQQLK